MSRWDVENPRGSIPGVNPATMGPYHTNENMMAKYLLLKHYRGAPGTGQRRADGAVEPEELV
jgi:hypothetical protein